MTAVACPWCVLNGRPGSAWHATGLFVVNRRGLRRAAIVCGTCGDVWHSAQAEALAAAEAVAATLPPEEDAGAAPEPVRLPGVLPLARPATALRPIGDLARDFKRRQGGDDE